MHTINMCMCGTPCPHVALAWMEQSRHDNLVQLYRANMNKGDRAAAKEVLAALDIHCSVGTWSSILAVLEDLQLQVSKRQSYSCQVLHAGAGLLLFHNMLEEICRCICSAGALT